MAPLFPLPLPSKWTLSFCVCCVTKVGPSWPGPSPRPSLAPKGSPFRLGLLSPARSGKLGLRCSRRIPPSQAHPDWRKAHSRPRAPTQRHHDRQVALPLADGRCRAGPQTHLVQMPGQSSPGRSHIKAKHKPLISPFHPRKWEGGSSLTAGFSPLSLFQCRSRLSWMAPLPIPLRQTHQWTGCREGVSP